MAFAKLYETQEHGQILVMLQDGEEGPEIRLFVEPPNLGVCSIALGWKNSSEKDWDQAEAAFNEMTKVKAIAGVSELWAFASTMAPTVEEGGAR